MTRFVCCRYLLPHVSEPLYYAWCCHISTQHIISTHHLNHDPVTTTITYHTHHHLGALGRYVPALASCAFVKEVTEPPSEAPFAGSKHHANRSVLHYQFYIWQPSKPKKFVLYTSFVLYTEYIRVSDTWYMYPKLLHMHNHIHVRSYKSVKLKGVYFYFTRLSCI